MRFQAPSRARRLVAPLGCALLLGAASACVHAAPRDAPGAPAGASGETRAPADAGGQATGAKTDRKDRPAGDPAGPALTPSAAEAEDATETTTAGAAAGSRTKATPDPAGSSTAPASGPAPRSATTAGAGSGPGAPGRGSQAAGLPLQISLAPDSTTLSVGDLVGIDVMVASAAPVVDAPLHLLYDPAVLRFFDAAEGDFLKQDGAALVFLVNGLSRAGDVALGIGRTDRARGAAGGGRLCRVRFVALAPGVSAIRVGSAMAWGEDGAVLPISAGSSSITVR